MNPFKHACFGYIIIIICLLRAYYNICSHVSVNLNGPFLQNINIYRIQLLLHPFLHYHLRTNHNNFSLIKAIELYIISLLALLLPLQGILHIAPGVSLENTNEIISFFCSKCSLRIESALVTVYKALPTQSVYDSLSYTLPCQSSPTILPLNPSFSVIDFFVILITD